MLWHLVNILNLQKRWLNARMIHKKYMYSAGKKMTHFLFNMFNGETVFCKKREKCLGEKASLEKYQGRIQVLPGEK